MVLSIPHGTHDIPHGTEHPHGTKHPHGTAHTLYRVFILYPSFLKMDLQLKEMEVDEINLPISIVNLYIYGDYYHIILLLI